ncbi:hypothetical protein [Paracoccus benzoatiresistens]|uniref:Uncharacterized protein n=1 Tax=Paracoccus benzoatiresistens TaxID=2997341 RepID=A0ABT4J9V4_9RHOB|nr:hypothetical protein [Paracoccus sp. EF6]MCZ0963857.1 hypothetical protein [Paracoccus sp. EF6]
MAIDFHSTYKLHDLRIEYPWHPLFGRVLHARDGGRRHGSDSILVEERPGFFRTLPPWMCDPAYCSLLDSGPPLVALEALDALARTLDLMRHAQVAPCSGRLLPEEEAHALPTQTPVAAEATGAQAALLAIGRQPEPSPGSTSDTPILEALAELLLVAANKMAEGAQNDACKDHR